jgi:hypothetical protein
MQGKYNIHLQDKDTIYKDIFIAYHSSNSLEQIEADLSWSEVFCAMTMCRWTF